MILNDNEKVAIAAAMWVYDDREPGWGKDGGCGSIGYSKAPDMHDLVNIYEALNKFDFELVKVTDSVICLLNPIYSWNGVMDDYLVKGQGKTIVDAVFNALLAKYNYDLAN